MESDLNEVNLKISSEKSQLEDMKLLMENNVELVAKMDLVQELDVLIIQLKLNSKVNQMSLNSIQRIEGYLTENQNGIRTSIKNYEKIATDIFEAEMIISSHKLLKTKINKKMKESPKLIAALKNFTKAKNVLVLKANIFKTKCMKAIQLRLKMETISVEKVKEYKDYLIKINTVKSLLKSRYNLKQKRDILLKEIKKVEAEITLNKWKRFRIYPEELSDLDEAIDALERLTKLASSKHDLKIIKDKTLLVDIQTIYENYFARKYFRDYSS